MDRALLKEQVKKVMRDHLVATYGEEFTPDQVMTELKNMWIKLEEANLIQPGMSFHAYAEIANAQYTFHQLRGMMGF